MHRRALIVCCSSEIGGMERLALGISRQLEARGWESELVFAGGPRQEEVLSWARQQGVRASASPAVHTVLELTRPWRSVFSLAAFIRSRRPDVVNLHYGGSHISLKDVLGARLAGARRVVAEVHLPVDWELAGRRKKLLTRIAAMLTSGVVVHSEAVRQTVSMSGVPDGKIRLVPPGVLPPPTIPARDAARTTLCLDEDAFVVGCMARLVPHKGVDVLIRAMAAVDPCARLLIAGDGPQRAELETLAREFAPGRVRFLGALSGTESSFYAALDLFVLPSYLEGFGLVLTEAAFHGVPVVGTDIGGVRDAICPGKTGLLVQPGDPAALAAAMERLRRSPEIRHRLSSEGRRRAHAEFSEEAMGRRMEAVLLARPRTALCAGTSQPK